MDIKSGHGMKDVWPSALHREETIPINKGTFMGLQPSVPARLCINLIPKDSSAGPVIRLWMEITHVVARSQATSIDAGIWGAGLHRDHRSQQVMHADLSCDHITLLIIMITFVPEGDENDLFRR